MTSREFPGLDDLKIAINSYTMDQFGDLTFLRTTTHEYCAIRKVSVINPYLILQNNGVAPYAYDITVTPLLQQSSQIAPQEDRRNLTGG